MISSCNTRSSSINGTCCLKVSTNDSREGEVFKGLLNVNACAAVINSIIIEAVSKLLERGERVPVLTSANVEGTSADTLREVLNRYRDRIRYLDLETDF